jgi:hypothetical protein
MDLRPASQMTPGLFISGPPAFMRAAVWSATAAVMSRHCDARDTRTGCRQMQFYRIGALEMSLLARAQKALFCDGHHFFR